MNRRPAFTLTELAVGVAILAILVAMILPAIANARATSQRASCQNNLRQLGIALHDFHNTHGTLPPRAQSINNAPPRIYHGWMVHLLNYIEREQDYRRAMQAAADSPHDYANPPHAVKTTIVSTYICPADSRLTIPQKTNYGELSSHSSYIGNQGYYDKLNKRSYDGVLGTQEGIRFNSIVDGLSNTLLVVERPPPGNFQAGTWYEPFIAGGSSFHGPNNGLVLGGVTYVAGDPCVLLIGLIGPGRLDNPCDRYHIWSLHLGRGANCLFSDGSVRFLSYSVRAILPALATRSGNESAQPVD